MSHANPTKKQHFVPRFYLKNFASPEGDLQVLNVKENRMAKPRPYQGLGYEYFYYALTTGKPDEIAQQVEEWFKPMEDFISNKLPKIIEKIETNQQIQDDDKYILSVLMSMLWLRTPGMRAQMKAMDEDMAKQIKRLHGGEGSGDRFRSKSNMGHLICMVKSLGFGNAGFANMFFAMKWTAFLACGNEQFITTDSPVVEKWLPPKGFYGAGFMQRDKYFALTPKILLHLTHPVGSKKLKRKTLYEAQDDEAKMLNVILISNTQSYAYSGRKKELEALLNDRNRPGKLTLEYIEKYEKPWAEWRAKMGK